MVAYTKPQQREKEENERLRGEGDKIKFRLKKMMTMTRHQFFTLFCLVSIKSNKKNLTAA